MSVPPENRLDIIVPPENLETIIVISHFLEDCPGAKLYRFTGMLPDGSRNYIGHAPRAVIERLIFVQDKLGVKIIDHANPTE